MWDDKIKVISYKNPKERYSGSYTYVTYIGDYRPSDEVLIYWANNWNPVPVGAPGFGVKRVDYKTYEIHEYYTD
jgi:hypothetical protein